MPISKNSKIVSISKELYDRIKPSTNDFGGRNVKKESFTTVITTALDDQDRLKKRKINKKE